MFILKTTPEEGVGKKRDSLKRLGEIGVFASVSLGAWVSPVVNSVLLPSHAQTSENCSSLAIPDISVSCSQNSVPTTFIVTDYTFNLQNGCLASAQATFFPTFPPLGPANPNVFRVIQLRTNAAVDEVQVGGITLSGSASVRMRCDLPTQSQNTETLALSVGGIPHMVRFNLIEDSTGVTMSSIVVFRS